MILSSQAVAEDSPQKGVQKVRVLHLSPGKLYGGVETALVSLARFRHLCPGMEPHFGVCFAGRLSDELTAAGVRVHLLGEVRLGRPWTVWLARRRLRKVLSQERYDAVVCHMPWPMVVFGSTARSSSRLIFWGHSSYNGRDWLERLARRVLPDLAVSSSRFVQPSIGTLYPGVDTRVIYCPVPLIELEDAPHWRSKVRRELGVDDDTVVIIQLSRYEPYKGHLLHLEALSRLQTASKWVCWMIGGAQNAGNQAHYEEVRRATERLGLTDRVRFLGERSDVTHLLAASDIFCQPNEGPEPFGIVFVEALWAGLPVVTTAMGGGVEIVDESCGLLAEPGNAGHLAGLLERLIGSSDLRARLGQAGPARARQLCEPGSQLNELHGLLQQSIVKRTQVA
ncbi:MAG TPA: glycosyltransferase [Bryobacteraceae bacterium]|nr:glycosyltransferase [Bryobacteraceae bacterium]